MRFLYFLFFFSMGLAIIYYRERIQRFTGNFSSAEKYLGPGGTFSFIFLLGLAVVMLSVFYITGTLDGFIGGTFGRFFLVPNS